jgi:thymidine phosphorylase
LVRRYPTGAVSEKVALILPSLISGTRAVVPIASTFLVAKSLGFTGGTWDKLRAIPGFRFPKPGKETLDIIEKSAVAMTVTQESFNPADRKMYQLRSVTGTIESIELIAASIASKQMALPADHLLLDVRYGPGAFVEKLADAHALAELIVSLLKSEGLLCTFNMTDTQQPTGSAIGNALEVAEAIEVMKNEGNQCPWDRRSIKAQQEIVLGLWGAMLRPLFPEGVVDKYNTLGRQFIFNGMLQRAFAELLEVHGVSRYDITKLVTDPLTTLTQGCECITVCSSRKGIFSSVDQRRLGYFVNFSLGGGGNDYAGDFDSRAGVLLAKRLGDSVAMGEPIARIYVPRETFDAAWLADETRECLEIV